MDIFIMIKKKSILSILTLILSTNISFSSSDISTQYYSPSYSSAYSPSYSSNDNPEGYDYHAYLSKLAAPETLSDTTQGDTVDKDGELAEKKVDLSSLDLQTIQSPAALIDPEFELQAVRASAESEAFQFGSWTRRSDPYFRHLTQMTTAAYGMTRKDLIKTRKKALALSVNTLKTVGEKSDNTIPHVMNRVWLTGKGREAHEAPLDSLAYYVDSVNKLKDWDGTHHFWCKNPADIPQTIKYLKSNAPQIQIHSISELKFVKQPGRSLKGVTRLFNSLIDNNHYTIASDILRIAILQETKGGFYSDLGVQFNNPTAIKLIADSYQSVFFAYQGTGDLDSSFCGSVANNPAFEKYLGTLNDLIMRRLPPSIKHLTRKTDGSSCQDIEKQLWWTGMGHLTATVFSTFDENHKTLFLADNTFTSVHHNHSWGHGGKPTKFGQKALTQSEFRMFKIRNSRR